MNTKSIVIAGIGAGVVVWVVDSIANVVVLRERFAMLVKAGIFLEQPRLPFFLLWTLVMLGLGFGLAWLYASVRPRLGPGPKTAAAVGFVVGLMIYTPSNLAQASWSMVGRIVPIVWLVFGVIGTTAGALVAGGLYKEEPAKQ